MGVGRVFLVLGVVALLASLFLPWVRVDAGFLRVRVSLWDADEAYKVIRKVYVETVCAAKTSDVDRTACVMSVPSSSPFSWFILYILFMLLFMFIGFTDRIYAAYHGFLIVLLALSMYSRLPELLAGPLASVLKGFVDPDIGFYLFAGSGLLGLIGGAVGWPIKVKSKGQALVEAFFVGIGTIPISGLTFLALGILYQVENLLTLIAIASLMMFIIITLIDYFYRASNV